MGTINSIIILLIVGTILAVAFVFFKDRIFGAVGEAGNSFTKFAGKTGDGITGFFDRLSKAGENNSTDSGEVTPPLEPDVEKQTDEEQKALFDKFLSYEEELAIASNDDTRKLTPKEEEILRQYDEQNYSNDSNNSPDKFNPDGRFGYGQLGLNKEGISKELAVSLGLIDTKPTDISDAQVFALSTIANGLTSLDGFTDRILDLFNTPTAYASEGDGIPIEENDTSNNTFKESKNQKRSESKVIFISKDNPVGGFSYHNANPDSNGFGSIREIPEVDKAVRNVDRNSSASKRANDKYLRENGDFDTGTNDGRGKKIVTTNRGGETRSSQSESNANKRRTLDKEREANKAQQLFIELYGNVN